MIGKIRGFNLDVAVRLDVPKAIILEQLAYRTSRGNGSKVLERGVETRWLHRTFEELQEYEFPFWSLRTVKGHFKALAEMGLIESTKLGSQPFDRTKAWRVVHDHPFWSDKRPDDSATIAPSESEDLAPSDSAESALSSSINKEETEETTPPANAVEDIVNSALSINREEEIDRATQRPDHGPTVSRYWHKMMSYHKKAQGLQPKVGQGEIKMLKVLFQALGEDGPKILDHAMANWDQFQKFTRENYDIKLTVQPQIKALAQLRNSLAEFAHQKPELAGEADPYAGLKTSSADFEE